MAKTLGYGSVLTVTTTTGEVDIAQVRNITGPGTQAADVDTTTLDSSTNFRTFVQGPVDPGELSATLVYDPTALTHKRLAFYHAQLTVKTYKVYHGSSTGDSDSFTAYVKSLGREIPLDDVITCDVGFKLSGAPGYST